MQSKTKELEGRMAWRRAFQSLQRTLSAETLILDIWPLEMGSVKYKQPEALKRSSLSTSSPTVFVTKARPAH